MHYAPTSGAVLTERILLYRNASGGRCNLISVVSCHPPTPTLKKGTESGKSSKWFPCVIACNDTIPSLGRLPAHDEACVCVCVCVSMYVCVRVCVRVERPISSYVCIDDILNVFFSLILYTERNSIALRSTVSLRQLYFNRN